LKGVREICLTLLRGLRRTLCVLRPTGLRLYRSWPMSSRVLLFVSSAILLDAGEEKV
jgi:hypothetical protein